MPIPRCRCFALRDAIGLTGTKSGCGAAQCGACTVHLDGQAIRSCVTPISEAEGKRLTTIEAATDGTDRVGAAVHAAWAQARRGAVRLLPERPDHERDRLPQIAAQRQAADRQLKSTRPWTATSAAAAPMPASAPPWPTPPARSPEGAAMLPNHRLPRSAARRPAPDGAQSNRRSRHAAAPQLPEAGRRRRPGARRLSSPGNGAGYRPRSQRAQADANSRRPSCRSPPMAK